MSSTQSKATAGSHPPLFDTLTDDFHIVVEDIRRRGLKRAVGGTLSSLEAFYLTDDDRRRLTEMTPARRWLRRIWWLIKGLLMKLTPARRIMLAAALVILLFGTLRIDYQSTHIRWGTPITGTVLVVAVLTLELKDKLTARDELEAGRKVQLALMPSESPRIAGWDIWLYTRPANDVGGDLVDHLALGDNQHVIALGDVAGKALPAALLSVKLQATLRALAPRFGDLGDLGAEVNRILERDGLPSRFASLLYLVLTADSGHLRVLNAGHMPPLHVHGGAVTLTQRGSVVLGIMPGATFAEQQLDLVSGDVLIVYSDGVTEAMNEAGDFFGDERLFAIAERTAALNASAIGNRILEAVGHFVGEAPASDDISLMILRRLRAPA